MVCSLLEEASTGQTLKDSRTRRLPLCTLLLDKIINFSEGANFRFISCLNGDEHFVVLKVKTQFLCFFKAFFRCIFENKPEPISVLPGPPAPGDRSRFLGSAPAPTTASVYTTTASVVYTTTASVVYTITASFVYTITASVV